MNMISLREVVVILFSLMSLSASKSMDGKGLKLVIVIHRHGDRTPVFTYPTDPYKEEEKYFPDGFGMLTSKGKERMFTLGKYIRKRYKNFLTSNPREVYIRSSAKERCLESVSLLMAGLYPPEGRWKWGKGLGQMWQPFPIRTTLLSQDGLLNPDSDCPLAGEEVKSTLKSDAVKKFFKKYDKTVKFVEQKIGLPFNDHHIGRDLFNALEIQKNDFGLKLPEWVNETVYNDLKEFLAMSFIFDASTERLKRLRAGMLLKEIKSRIEESISNAKSAYKLLVYSTHDTQLTVFLSALNVYNSLPPPFGATVFLEVHQMDKNNYNLEMHYLNVTESEKTFRLPIGCDSSSKLTSEPKDRKDKKEISQSDNCLRKFFKSFEKLIPEDWEQECQKKGYTKKNIKAEL